MIAAARADGKLEGREGEAIFQAVDRLALDAGEKALLLEELARPVDIDTLVAAAQTPEMKAIFEKGGLVAPVDKNADEARIWLKNEMETWRRDIADAGIKVEE